MVVVVTHPCSGHLPGFRTVPESVIVQAFIPEAPVEALAGTILHGPPWLDQVVDQGLLVPPLVEGPRGSSGPLSLTNTHLRTPSLPHKFVQHLDHPQVRQAEVYLDCQPISHGDTLDVQGPDGAPD